MDVDEPAHTHGDTVTCTVPMIAERADGVQSACRGVFYWDADDPIVVGIHFQIMNNSVPVTPERFPIDGGHITCVQCEEEIPYNSMGGIVRSGDDLSEGTLVCLMCADADPTTEYEESLWVLGRDSLEGVFADAPPADADAATARVWRLNEHNFQVALREKDNLLILTIPVNRLEILFTAVGHYESLHPQETESYLEGAFAELERMANGE